MKYIFKTKDEDEAKILMEAKTNYAILWELSHNFFRKFENADDSETKGIERVLKELANELTEFKDLEL